MIWAKIFSKTFTEQPKERLFSLRLVKALTIVVAIPFFISLAIVLFNTLKLPLQLDINGLNYFFFDAMRVPNSIALVYLALLGLVASNHRSEQSKEQLITANSQNNFVNYYKHLEEFENYSLRIPNSQTQKSKINLQQHLKLFPESRNGGYHINNVIADKLDDLAIQLVTSLPEIINKSLKKIASSLPSELKEKFKAASHLMGLTHSHLPDSMFIPDGKTPFNNQNDYRAFIRHYRDFIVNANYLFEFDPQYMSSDLVTRTIDELNLLLSKMSEKEHNLIDITNECCSNVLKGH
jgi:hypothetical protein